MKRPTIMYEGEKYPVEQIDWYSSSEEIFSVSFSDKFGKFHVALRKSKWDVEGYNDRKILHMDLEKALAHNEFWRK